MALLVNEGSTLEKTFHKDAALGPPMDKLRAGSSLKALTEDYVLFNYAPMCLFGGLDFNPVKEWINAKQLQRNKTVFLLPVEKDLFDFGIKTPFSKMLWAVVKDKWESLKLHIGSIALLNRYKKLYCATLLQELQIPDIDDKSTFTAFGFGITSNKGILAFDNNTPAHSLHPTRIPKLIYHKAETDIVNTADKLFNNGKQ